MASPDQDIPPLWQYVPLTDYQPPPVTMEHTVRTGLSAFWQRFRSEEPPAETPLKTEEELQSISGELLERIIPAPDSWPAALALDEALAEWLDSTEPHAPVIFVIDPPHGFNRDILPAWASLRAWQIVPPPTLTQVLDGETDWIRDGLSDSAPWVLPELERCYLRHAHGLTLVRGLLDQVCSGALGRGVIGCDSWAWAFLRRVWPGVFPPALILQSFDEQRLARWLQSLANASGLSNPLFRQADRGDYVLPPPDAAEGTAATSDFLKQLAAYSRGIPGIARAGWRASLRTVPDESIADADAAEKAADSATTFWITPWRRFRKPAPATGLLREHGFVLHTLLLHNGLPAEWLPKLLPLFPHAGLATLFRLETAGLVERQDDGLWRVAPLGYPAVRSFLKNEGYLTDDL
jgi:hypothetical protein